MTHFRNRGDTLVSGMDEDRDPVSRFIGFAKSDAPSEQLRAEERAADRRREAQRWGDEEPDLPEITPTPQD